MLEKLSKQVKRKARIKKIAERRAYPRIEQRLPFKVSANGYDFSTTTKNLSCIGAYCKIDKYIPPFTKVKVKLALPLKKANQMNKLCEIICEGVIVRTEDDPERGFNIAIFFNAISDEQRKKISLYINQFLPSS